MSRVKKYFIFLPLVLIFGCSEETITPNVTVAIQGVVFDQQTEALLPDARVTVINTFDVLETDSVGRFRFDSLNFRETFTIRVEKTGYRDQTATLNFLQDGNPEREVEIPMDIDLDLNKASTRPFAGPERPLTKGIVFPIYSSSTQNAILIPWFLKRPIPSLR